MPVTDLAICLRRSDYSETSLVLRVMTRQHGQVSLLAKGVKRPKSKAGGAIDLLAVGQAVFTLPRDSSTSELGILVSWDQTGHHPRLRRDLLRHAVAMTAGELLGRLTEELDPHQASFDAMVELLDALEAGEPPLRRLAGFARGLLADVGLTPNFQRCVNCGSEIPAPGEGPPSQPAATPRGHGPAGHAVAGAGGLLFSGPRGGVFCPRCRPGIGDSHITISRPLQDFFVHNGPLSGKLALEIARWLVYYVQHQLGHELRTAAALERAIAAALAEIKSRP